MISIIIIVKNDNRIKNTLIELLRIPKPEKSEIIVVDSSNGALDYIKGEFPEIQWIYYKSKKNKSTIPEQRNLGIRISKGEIIVFIDAGCIPTINWLMELIKPIYKDNENIIAGRNLSKSVNWNKAVVSKYLNAAPTINLAIKRNVFEEIGIFDENLDYGSDVDLTLRAIKAGYKIRFNEHATIYHDWGNFRSEVKRSIKYAQARSRLIIKHNDIRLKLIKEQGTTIFYAGFIIFSPIIYFYPVYISLIIIPIIKNYKNNPFKVIILNLIYALVFIIELVKNTLKTTFKLKV